MNAHSSCEAAQGATIERRRPKPKSTPTGLRAKPEGKAKYDRLPFVGKDHGPRSFWDVPLTGGYFGGIDAGHAIARMYLKYARDTRDDPITNGSRLLESILISIDAKRPATKEEQDSLCGQRVGFMSEICWWLQAAVNRIGSTFDAIPERSFIALANESLLRNDADLMARIKEGTQ